jgi:DNA-directed RNA polymerase specialized sigma24 family protein
MDVKPVDNRIFTAMFENVRANRERIAETMLVIATLAASRYQLGEVDSEDCVSDALVKLLQKIESFCPTRGGAFQFFYTVANYAVLDWLRKNARHVDPSRFKPEQKHERVAVELIPLDVFLRLPGGQWAWSYAHFPKGARLRRLATARDGQRFVAILRPRKLKHRRHVRAQTYV